MGWRFYNPFVCPEGMEPSGFSAADFTASGPAKIERSRTCRRFLRIILLFLAVSFSAQAQGFAAKADLWFLDAGYGDAVVVRTAEENHTLLIDAGTAESSEKILAFLESQGIRQIDTAILTHPHKNHFGGYPAVLKHMTVKRFFYNGDPEEEEPFETLRHALREKKITPVVLRAGDVLPGLPEGYSLEVLHPENLSRGVNDNSLALLFRAGEEAVLFTSDIGPEVQQSLGPRFIRIPGLRAVQVPHHGGPLEAGFGDFFGDVLYIVSTGPNPWGLPDESALSKLPGPVHRTDREGNIHITIGL